MASTMAQCLASGIERADESCRPFLLKPLSLPTPLEPLAPSSSHYAMLTTPLFLLGLSLLVLSLFASHHLSKTPIEKLGQVGARGRWCFGWNESFTGDCGGRFFHWWMFGGSVWIRAWLCVWDFILGSCCVLDDEGHESDLLGENLFACINVSSHDAVPPEMLETKTEEKGQHSSSNEKDEDSQENPPGTSFGVLGYDSSLGAHGPLILAPLRASILLLAWCSVCSFLVMTHKEVAGWIGSVKEISSMPFFEIFLSISFYTLQGIQSIMNTGKTIDGDINVTASGTDPPLCVLFPTMMYATSFIAQLEISLYILAKVCAVLKILPWGVSHPGGPRPHKIVRVPQWREGKEHFLPKELLLGGGGDINSSKWRCAVAHDAHRDTLIKFKNAASKATLSGEPFGRQIWTELESQPPSGQGKTEDDLEATLGKVFPETISQNGMKKQPKKGEEDSTDDKKGDQLFFRPFIEERRQSKEDQPDTIGNFVHNQFAASGKEQEIKGQKPKEDRKKLIQTLASGGRYPPLAFDPSKNPNSCDQLFRAQMIASYLEKNDGKLPEDISYLQQQNTAEGQSIPPKTPIEAAKRGIAFYSILQTSDGHFAGDYGGPHFLLPGLVVAWYVMGRPSVMISPDQQALMLHYLKVHQQKDGGWGTHIESPSTMFGTTVCYLAVRLLGGDKDLKWVKKGQEFIQREGGAVMTSSWAKFWLCLIGCMDWKGHNSVPPEMWLLPNFFPFHPGRMWCHCRMVYLPMGYLYGSKFIYSEADTDPLIRELREELYCQSYDSIDWDSTRHLVAPMDNYSPIPAFMKFSQNCLSIYENWKIFRPFRDAVRKAGLRFCSEYMKAEDLQTNYIDIGPVNKALNMVSAFHAANNDINDPSVRNHMMRVPDYLWIAEDGMKMQGYNGSQCWDTSFAIQAVWECGMLDEFPILSAKVWAYLERTQILSTNTSQSSPAFHYELCYNRDKFYRHVSKGGWPFSTSAHGWPISDCTGEGLKGVLALMDSPIIKSAVKEGILNNIEPSRLFEAANVILTLQNEDGGWATYENNRGFGWYEELNPSEVFGDIMIDYSYVECSMASLTALAEFHEKFPHHRTKEIAFAIHRGGEFMKSIQREDGSWYGSWACCFCYGCWFGIEGLIKAGESHTSQAIKRCCNFLLSQQRPNGGWGEDFTSCYDKDYAENGMEKYGDYGSGVVNTAWALLALSAAKCSDIDAIRRGVHYLMKRQLDCGDWPQEGISGVFNRACGITYTAYRNVFPIWALGRCVATYGSTLDED
mmetsp:Transcript_23740/g.50823  ORF Transcript_23740/g.50823 Transcript_23740/m.50823 type:complete len:1267 (+) Transcript_23740:97-3897(+)